MRVLLYVLTAFMMLAPFQALADAKIALVIGNSTYENTAALPNAKNDATDIAAKLTQRGFKVTLVNDLDLARVPRTLGAFRRASRDATIALVYFAGHGIELSGENYIIPVDAYMESEEEAVDEAVSLDKLQSLVQGASSLGLVMIDACRNNPWDKTIDRISKKRSVGRGLAAIEEPQKGMVVSFAAQPGAVADDGNGRNSPYAQALLEALDKPGLEIGFFFRQISARVEELTKGEQNPMVWDDLPNHSVYLVPPEKQKVETAAKTAAIEPDADSIGQDSGTVFRSSFQTTVDGLTECDTEAGYAWHPRVPDGSIAFSKINPTTAVPACLRAIVDYPDEKFFYFLAARALWKADEHDPQIRTYFERGAEADPAFALERLGHMAYNGRGGFEKDVKVAESYYLKAADAGHPLALVRLGDLYRDAEPPDHAKAKAVFQEALDRGVEEAAAKLAYQYEKFEGTPVDWPRVYRLYQIAADADVAWAIRNIGYLRRDGKGLDAPDPQGGFAAFSRACDLGNNEACYRAGRILKKDPFGAPKDFEKAAGLFAIACDNDYASGCFDLGYGHATQQFASASDAKAEDFYEKACDLENGGACNNLAVLIESDRTTRLKDENLIAVYYEKGCSLNDKFACRNLASDYEKGSNGTEQSFEEATEFYIKSCDLKYGRSCGNLAALYEREDVGGAELEKAATFFGKGCELDNAWSCARYADLPRKYGTSIKDDPLEILEKSCKLESSFGCRRLAQMQERNSTAQGNNPTLKMASVAAFEKGCDLRDGFSCGYLGWGAFPNGQSDRESVDYLMKSLKLRNRHALTQSEHYPASFTRVLQTALKGEGTYTGAIDGKMGPGTRAAMQAIIER